VQISATVPARFKFCLRLLYTFFGWDWRLVYDSTATTRMIVKNKKKNIKKIKTAVVAASTAIGAL